MKTRHIAAAVWAGSTVFMAGSAAAQCISVNPTTVQCTGIGPDGVTVLPPTNNVVVQGQVVGTRAIDARPAPAITVVNSGDILGSTAGIDSIFGLDLQNFGKVIGLGNDAVRAGASGKVNNLFGTIESIGSGSAITGTSELTVTNTGGDIKNQTGSTAIDAGLGGIVSNQAGGDITSVTGSAIAGSFDLVVDNGPDSDVSSLQGVAIDTGIGAEVTNFGSISGVGALSYGLNGDLTNFGEIENRVGSGPAAAVEGEVDLDVDNKFGGAIDGRFGAAVSVRNGFGAEIDNDGDITSESTSRATIELDLDGTSDLHNSGDGKISNAQGDGVLSEGGTLRLTNAGTITAGDRGILQRDGNLTLSNAETGTIRGSTGLAFEAGHDGTRDIDNAGRLEGTSSIAMNVASDLGTTEMILRDDSEIIGDVFFGGGDDALTILDLSSQLLSTGIFDAGAGLDTLFFGSNYELSDITGFDFTDTVTFRTSFVTEAGETLTGTFRNFELVEIAGLKHTPQAWASQIMAPVPLPASLPLLVLALLPLVRRQRPHAIT